MISNTEKKRDAFQNKRISMKAVMMTLLGSLVITLIGGRFTSASAATTAYVLVGAGDISSCGNDNDSKTAKLLGSIAGTIFTTGDNVYDKGSATQYTNCYKPTWGLYKSRTKPVPGNHEYLTSGASAYYQYFGVAKYYAYNLGSWRIYALNSEIDTSATSTEVKWLKADLANNPRKCVMAYWHRPRWSSGKTHGNDTKVQALWQALADAKAEIVVTGHEHNYERFAPMTGSGTAVSAGLQEFVMGTGGSSHYGFGTILSTSRARNATTYGVLKLTLYSGSYSWKFIPVAGSSYTDSGSVTCH